MEILRRLRNLGSAALAASTLSACASIGQLPPAQVSDPFESANRSVYAVNSVVNQAVFVPILVGYETLVLPPVRQSVSNALANLNEPTIFANNILQGRFSASLTTLTRFTVNSTLGAGGLFDIATLGGLPKQTGDFGQTLFVWGVNDSPYIMMPLLGPSTFRDAIGYGIDAAASPGGYAIYRVGGTVAASAVGGFEALRRARDLQTVDDTAVDPYVRLRSIFYQTRRRDLLDAIGRKDDIFDPLITDGGLRPADMPIPPRRGAAR